MFRVISRHQFAPVTDPQVLPAGICVRCALRRIHILEHIVGQFHLTQAFCPQTHIEPVASDLSRAVRLTPEDDAVDHIIELRFIIGVGNGCGLFHLPVRPMGAESLFCEHDPGLRAVGGLHVFCQLFDVFHRDAGGVNGIFHPFTGIIPEISLGQRL